MFSCSHIARYLCLIFFTNVFHSSFRHSFYCSFPVCALTVRVLHALTSPVTSCYRYLLTNNLSIPLDIRYANRNKIFNTIPYCLLKIYTVAYVWHISVRIIQIFMLFKISQTATQFLLIV